MGIVDVSTVSWTIRVHPLNLAAPTDGEGGEWSARARTGVMESTKSTALPRAPQFVAAMLWSLLVLGVEATRDSTRAVHVASTGSPVSRTAFKPMYDSRRAYWLAGIAARIPRLFALIAEGHVESGYVLGEKRIGERRVELTLVARVVEGAVRQTDTWDVLPPLSPPGAGVPDVDARADDAPTERPAARHRRPRRDGPLG